MNTEKLNQIVADKNAELEREAVYRARKIIDGIATLQQEIATATTDIETLRAELKALTIDQVDASKILG